jgi:hypothetical protein
MLGDPERVLGAKPRGLSVGNPVRVRATAWREHIPL